MTRALTDIDILVVGGGPAGIGAALGVASTRSAAEGGASGAACGVS